MKNGKQRASFFIYNRISRIVIDILFPPLCAHCETYLETSATQLCDTCYTLITKNTSLLCPICPSRVAHNRKTCNHGKKDAARFPYLLGAATYYDDPIVRHCIYLCKYEGLHALTDTLALLLVQYVRELNPQLSICRTRPLVVPIPLHTAKERKRGFNQSALVAQKFANAMQLPYDELLVKIINNAPQAQAKTHKKRFERINEAFATPRPMDVQNKNIILIDDVSTSGATLSQAAQTLKAAGAKQILALVIAKA